ncbi:hypothetical protein JCM8115_003013 [Rhodotorula mucilaginosa]
MALLNLDEVRSLSSSSETQRRDDGTLTPTLSRPHLLLSKEVRLTSSNSDRERVAELANLYSLILALDYLERAHVRDAVSPQQYHPACTRLLNQYKTILHLVGSPALDEFMKQYRMDCTAARHRLQVGVPATVEHHHGDSPHSGNGESHPKTSNGQPSSNANPNGNETAQWVAETTQNFITFMDALKLKLRAKDQLHPLLTELMQSYARFSRSNDWAGRPKILNWLIELNQLRGASDEISDEQARQMLFDIEHAYAE